jgi:hypothetical protein
MIDAKRPPGSDAQLARTDLPDWLGLDPNANGLGGWDLYDAVLTPGDLILLMSWHDHRAAEEFEKRAKVPQTARVRRVRVVRDYGMFDRREAPQYYRDVQPR